MLLMSLRRGGSDCLTPFNMPHKKKQARAPVLDNGCHGYRSLLRHEISGESTESVCLRKCVRPCVCVRYKRTVMSSLLFRPIFGF